MTHLNDDLYSIEQVVGNLQEFQSESSWEIFNSKVLEMLRQLSFQILHDKRAKNFPDLISLGFAIRPANIHFYQEMFPLDLTRRGRGKIFHITPANVPLNFAFSYVYALLAGNPSCVRLSSKNFPQVELFNEILASILSEVKFEFIRKSTCFIRYPHDKKITDYLSSTCDVRIIWGGDSTINEIRKSILPIGTIDVAFPDRYSFSLLNAEYIKNIDERELNLMIESFFTDAYLFDQKGCSSPKLICWMGSAEQVLAASQIFWPKFRALANSRYDLQMKNSIDKFVDVCVLASSSFSLNEIDISDNYLSVVSVDLDSALIGRFQGQFGTFLQCRISDWSELQLIVSRKFQTMTYFGFEVNLLRRELMSLPLKGIDRVVPVGQAFDISMIWDGINFVETLSRIVEFK